MTTKSLNKVLVVDFGSQTTQLIVRRVREIGIYCEIVSYKDLYLNIKKNKPEAIILSGGPASSFEKKSPKLEQNVLQMNIPILGICYGMQIICQTLGGRVQSSTKREFGKAEIKILEKNLLFKGIDFSKK